MAGETENPVIDAGNFLGENGAFAENWQEQAYGETDPLRSDPTLKNIKDVRTMAKRVVDGQQQIGKLTGGREFAIIPNPNADKESEEHKAEVKAYRAKTGVPEESTGYKLNEMQLPEGLPKNEKLATHMEGVLHKAGASPAVAAAVHNGYAEFIQASVAEAATQEKLDDTEANVALRKALGATYETKIASATTAINAFGNKIDAAEAAKMIQELPYDSFGTQFLALVGEAISETPLGQKPADTTGAMTPADAMTEINKIMTDPYYLTASPKDKPRNQAYHEELVQKVNKLFIVRRATKAGV